MRDRFSTNVEAAAYMARMEEDPPWDDRPSPAELVEDTRELKSIAPLVPISIEDFDVGDPVPDEELPF